MNNLKYIDARTISESLTYTELVASLKDAFAQIHDVPERLHYSIGERLGIDVRLLVMVAWGGAHYLGIKMVTLNPDNPAQGLPSLSGIYCLFNGKTGQPLAILDGAELTAFRTAAASMLAARYAMTDSPQNVLVLGAGNLSSYFIKAYAETMKPVQIGLWSRDVSKAEKVVEQLELNEVSLSVIHDLESAVKQANVISTLTSSTQPLFPGEWCQPGCHLDLVGAYRPDMRETDDKLISRAMIYVDNYEAVLKEAGDIILPLEAGIISRQDICAELSELARGEIVTPMADKDLTVFKSVGSAVEDLAAAALVYEKNKL